MNYESLKWVRQSEYRWRAGVLGDYEIVWESRDDGIAVLHGHFPAIGGAIRMKATSEGIARVALGLIEKELNAGLPKEAKAQLVLESEDTLKTE